MFNTFYNIKDYELKLATKITTLARFGRLGIALRCAPDVLQVCCRSAQEVPYFDSTVFFWCVFLCGGTFFIVFLTNSQTFSNDCRHVCALCFKT